MSGAVIATSLCAYNLLHSERFDEELADLGDEMARIGQKLENGGYDSSLGRQQLAWDRATFAQDLCNYFRNFCDSTLVIGLMEKVLIEDAFLDTPED